MRSNSASSAELSVAWVLVRWWCINRVGHSDERMRQFAACLELSWIPAMLEMRRTISPVPPPCRCLSVSRRSCHGYTEDLDSVHRLPAAADDVMDMDSRHLDRVHSSDVLSVWVDGRSETCVVGPWRWSQLTWLSWAAGCCNSPSLCDVIKLGVLGVGIAGRNDNISIVSVLEHEYFPLRKVIGAIVGTNRYAFRGLILCVCWYTGNLVI